MTRFTKDDVEYHAEYAHDRHAAVNVKDYGSYREHVGALEAALSDLGLLCDDLDALTEAINADEGAQYFAAEDGWEQANEAALNAFGPGYGVTSEGRMGGWAVVTYNGRPAFDEDAVAGWDAIAVARWGRFAREVRMIADDNPFRIAWSYLANVVEPAVFGNLAETGVGL